MTYSAPPDILTLSDDAQLAWAAIEPIWDDLPLSPAKRLEAFLEGLTTGQAALLAIDWCQKDIRNGGHAQLFQNASGNLVPWAIDGFRLIGGDAYAANLAAAAALLGADYPVSGAARKRPMQALTDDQRQTLETLSDAFLDLLYGADTDLEAFRATYIRANPAEFIAGA
ncbi:MAG: DUF4375 domain-containing protein [Rhodobacteraceae bacterium]|nr:DUF4375 domain-containing protein [Paracoccaceae bacterium]